MFEHDELCPAPLSGALQCCCEVIASAEMRGYNSRVKGEAPKGVVYDMGAVRIKPQPILSDLFDAYDQITNDVIDKWMKYERHSDETAPE